MAQKRKLDEYESDMALPSLSSDALPDRPAQGEPPRHQSGPAPPPALTMNEAATTEPSRPATTDSIAEIWDIAESKQSKKKKKKAAAAAAAQLKDDDSPPDLKFGNLISSPLRLKDLQDLVLYLLADGVAPQWVAVQQSKKIDKVVMLMIPGMVKELLKSFVEAAAAESPTATSSNANLDREAERDEVKPDLPVSQPVSNLGKIQQILDRLPSQGLHLIPVKAPGDKKTGRLHSVVQSMLMSPEPKAKSDTHNKKDAFRPVQTSILDFVHSADELVSADFPVHSQLFTNVQHAELEKERREATGQSTKDGWVDSDVNQSTLHVTGDTRQLSPRDQGLEVYAIDCEMVLTTDDKYSLARISILNWLGKIVMDKHVKPTLQIKNYFTQFSGITPQILEGVTTSLSDIQKELFKILTPSAVLCGHSLESDLNALKLTHPFLVDTALLYPHPGGLPLRSSLKFLAKKYLKREIQTGTTGHDSVEDARAALDLIRLKCEKGPRFGVADANGESIFARLGRSGHKTAIVDYGDPDRGFGQHADIKIPCQNDAEIVEGVVSTLSKEGEQSYFIWGRLRDLESSKGWDSDRNRYYAPKVDSEHVVEAIESHSLADRTLAALQRIYDCLPASTVLIVYPGPGDMREVVRLQDMYREFQREFKVKKWDDLSVQWTDNEEQALRRAFETARQGWALVGIK